MTPSPETSEGAADSIDALTVQIQHWIGDFAALQRDALRTVRLCRGTTSEARALALLGALHNPPVLPRALTTARTRAQQARDDAGALATSEMLAAIAAREPSGLLCTVGD